MNYPVLEVPVLGGGLLIALISILHVYIAHFAVGGGLYLVLTEGKAYREGDQALLDFVRGFSRVFVLLTVVFGAVTGVGIWFTVGTVTPPATSSLIHLFVWIWAMEYVPFFVEITTALVYYYGWDRLSPRMHLAVGWLYTVAAYSSLVFINGVLAFMLTPGAWPRTGNVWHAWWNPGTLPSLVMRTSVALALAGLFGLLTGTRLQDDGLRRRVVRYSAMWLWPAFIGLPLGGLWYFSRVPEPARAQFLGGAAAVTIFMAASLVLSVLILLFTYWGPYREPGRVSFPLALLFVTLGLLVTGTSEWVREAIRKPYVIYDYMYVNGIRPAEVAEIDRRGILRYARWARPVPAGSSPEAVLARGQEVFRLQCMACHTVDGYNGVRALVRGWTPEFTEFQLRHLNRLKGFMPPFAGTDEERRALAAWLASLNPRPPWAPSFPGTRPAVAAPRGGAGIPATAPPNARRVLPQ